MSQALEVKRTKHIDVRYHFVKDKVLDGVFKVEHVPTDKQIPDVLTKFQHVPEFEAFRELL
ncbi:unnamed protein product, partial [Nesidiocoris tenuis]